MRKIFRFLFFSCVFLACSGCFYKCNDPFSHKSVNIPYVEGDSYGHLTEALTYQLSSSGLFAYKQSADYRLEVAILSVTNDKIGYKREQLRGCTSGFRKNLLPIESRENIAAQVALRSNVDGELLWGPKIITADIDYDYSEQDSWEDLSFIDKNGQRQSILSFSLGQMETVFSAQESALRPLYHRLAKNIVSALIGELKCEDQ